MNDTLVTLVGNAATGVEFRETATGGMARFRFAVTPRRWDREKQAWTDGHTSFYTVWAWRTLASNLSGSVSVGEPLVVHGRLKVREEEREGRHRTFVDIEAVAVGHDLTRGTAAFRRVMRGDPGLMTRSGSVDRLGDSGGTGDSDGSGRSGGSYGVSRAERVERAGRDNLEERSECEEGGKQGEVSERVGRQRAKRTTGRQKGDQELASVP
ncbi:single-stranded DNA-binding protein [Streptomyces sp. NPDC018000]|uniref:single-stranded DNA-binding protein n=1 Tax=Streptomyces sp. NPDC018000 TaxID=3365028 RepID=UPI0037942D74